MRHHPLRPAPGTDPSPAPPDARVEALTEFLDETGFPSSPPTAPVGNSIFPLLLGADLLAIVGALVIGSYLASVISNEPIHRPWAAMAYAPLMLVVLGSYGLYRRGRRRLLATTFPDLSHLLHAIMVGSLLVLFVSGPATRWLALPIVPRTGAVLIAVLAVLGVPVCRAAIHILPGQAVRNARVLIVGSGHVAANVLARLTENNRLTVVGCVDDSGPEEGLPNEVPTLGTLDDLAAIVASERVDHLLVAFSPATGARLAALLRSMANEVQISVVPRLFDLLTVRSRVDDIHGLPVVDVAPASLGPADRFAKRALDIVAAGLGVLALSPLFLAIAVAIKVTSPGPVLFAQPRTGRRGAPFRIYKFRTMRVGAESERDRLASEVDGPLFKVRQDPRITRVGRILRRTSIDELPQLLNVLRGDMSLVGPRPFVVSESADIAGWAARRFDVRPGMTGLWQVSGRSDLPFEELCRLDYSYVASWSLWWDLRILWHTPAIVFRRRGAY